MTDKERIGILEKAKIRIDKNEDCFICPSLDRLIKSDIFTDVFKVFPELKKYKPLGCHLHGAWFGGQEGKYIRIKVLNNVIAEIKAKL
jgi:hypothetical protein